MYLHLTHQPTYLLQWYYGWDTRTQGWILSAFFIGYYVVQIPAGLLIQRFGAKRVTVGGALCLSMLQGVAVAAPRFGTPYFIVTMVLAGVANVSGCLCCCWFIESFIIFITNVSAFLCRC